MQNIIFTTAQDKIIITPEKFVATISQIVHDIPTIYSWVSNGLFSSMSEQIHSYCHNTYIKY